jgi:hypothetical protein
MNRWKEGRKAGRQTGRMGRSKETLRVEGRNESEYIANQGRKAKEVR